MNELTSGQVYHLTTYTGADVEIQRSVDEMRYAIKRIRMRAGVPDYSEETYNNPNDFRVKLKRERQIELLGENSMRYFDLRRWKDAGILGEKVWGVTLISVMMKRVLLIFINRLSSPRYTKCLNRKCICGLSRLTS